MSTMTRLASFSLLSLAFFGPAVADAAGAATGYRLSGKTIDAYGYFDDGCSYDYFEVFGSESILQDKGGPPSPSEGALVFGFGFDCETEMSYRFSGSGPADLLEIANNLSSASVEATITVEYCTLGPPDFIWNCEDMLVSADLSAQAIAPPQKTSRNEHTTLPDGTRTTERFKGMERESGVSGTMTIGAQVLPLQFATIGELSQGLITITPP